MSRRAAWRRCRHCASCSRRGPFLFRPGLRLPAAPVVIVLARHGSEHIEHHGVDRLEHARGEVVAVAGKLAAGRKIEGDNAHLPSAGHPSAAVIGTG
jgi:hypothetical protein